MKEQVQYHTATSGVVLAGGKSSRFGQDKGLFVYQGKPLVQHAIAILDSHCDEVLVSTNNPQGYAFTGLPTFEDIYRECGPLGGMHAGLVHASTECVFFLGCDMPHVPPAILPFLLGHALGYDAVVPVHHHFRETLCMVMRRDSLPIVEQAILERKWKILDMLAMLRVNFVPVSDQDFYQERIFHNINYRGDVE